MEDGGGVGRGEALYLYCFFDGSASPAPQRGLAGAGLTFALGYGDVCALVSPVSLEEYGEEVLNRKLDDPAWLTPRVRRHDEIVRAVMDRCPVIPVRFGTVYRDGVRVLALLQEAYDELRASLAFLRGKEEWGLKVYASEDAGAKVVASSVERLRALDERLASATPGAAHLLRKRREQLVREEALGWLEAVCGEVYGEAASCAAAAQQNAPLSRGATGRADEMVLNAAFLVRRPDVGAFQGRLDVLAVRYGEHGLSFVVSGPWPPYNFCPDLGGGAAPEEA